MPFADAYFFLLRTSCPSVLLKLREKQINRFNTGHTSRASFVAHAPHMPCWSDGDLLRLFNWSEVIVVVLETNLRSFKFSQMVRGRSILSKGSSGKLWRLRDVRKDNQQHHSATCRNFG